MLKTFVITPHALTTQRRIWQKIEGWGAALTVSPIREIKAARSEVPVDNRAP